MKRQVAAIFGLSCLSLGLIASPEEISLEEIEAECWSSAVLSNIPVQERDGYVGGCVDDYQSSLQDRVEDDLEYAPPNELEDASTAE